MQDNKMFLEGLLFLVGEDGLDINQISHALSLPEEEAIKIIEELEEDFKDDKRALKVVCFAGYYKLVTKEEVYDIAEQFFKEERSVPLSHSALETLAIIAYKQPITRMEIEEIRGVGCEVMLKKLVARELIEEKDRLDTPGKPIIYQVTSNFLDLFKLQSLAELPKFESLLNDSSDLFDFIGE